MTLKEWLADDAKDLSDAEAAAAANRADIAVQGRASVPALGQYLMESGLWTSLMQGVDSPKQAVAQACSLLLDAATAPPDSIALDSPGLSGALDAAQSEGIITQAQRAALDALGVSYTSLAARHGWGQVTEGDVQRARR